MTDPDDARAERALRDALTTHADSLEPAPLDPVVRRRRWPLAVAGAAALAVVAVTATFAVIDAGDDKGGPDPSAATAGDPATDATPATRRVSYRDLELEVPEDWEQGLIPNDNGCGYPSSPFVATYDPSLGYTGEACANPGPRAPEGFPSAQVSDWSPNVQLSPTSAAAESLPDGTQDYEGWILTRATVGTVRIEILTDASTADVVDPILASAHTVEVDANGCQVTSPAQAPSFVRPPAFDVTQVETVGSIAVCQYTRGDTELAGLLASTTLTGDDARDELAAIQAAAPGGGPDSPGGCASYMYGDQAMVLRLDVGDAEPRDLYVYYDWCFGNGIDDGTDRRELTVHNCSPLFTGAVRQFSGNGSTYRLCHPDA